MQSSNVSQDGASPEAGLIFDATGNLYGTTYSGGYGRYVWGTVFQLTPHANDKWTETILHTFNYHYQFKKGYGPMAEVVLDTGGNLYGTTAYGGDGFGTVFKLMPDANGKWGDTVLHTFNGKDGALPFAGLVFGSSGKLYGATQGGGTYNTGALFEITP
ncbi:MAG TPA: choice-of-anchor tandem repeat GloVer-containing protein [Terriglobales bacterium]|nr:choice-of-anchor tandem repeat GloVer-containing protein [Terriglobales bacterium]